MSLACSHCGSSYKIEEYDQRSHTITDYHCGMCGRNKFKDSSQLTARSSQEEQKGPLLTATSLELTANSPEVNMWKNKCDSKNCKSPSWGKSSAGNLLCFRHLMTDVKESGFAERLTRLIDECGSVDDIARVMRIDHKKITLALDGKLTDIQKVLVAAKINIGKEMRNWLFAGGDFPGLVKAEPPAPPEPPSPPEPATLPLPTNEADIIKALFTLSCRVETITLEENKDIILNEGDAPHHRIAEITFRYTNGEAPQFIALNMNVAEPYSFDDLVFLGAVIAEIKRIQEAP